MKDPQPYDGPIERADGARPFNRYLWPLEGDWFWAHHELGFRISSRWNFRVIALACGRYSTSGFVTDIERDHDISGPAVFPDRSSALRASAARMLRWARKARNWTGPDALGSGRFADVHEWVRAIVARETGGEPARSPVSRPIRSEAPPPPRPTMGLPLFDFVGAA